MSSRSSEIAVPTRQRRELVDVTAEVRAAVAAAGVQFGLCSVYCPHTTAGVTINENADPDVAADILRWVDEALGDERRFTHQEGNAGGHIMSSLFGCSVTVPVRDGALALGRWQALYLVEGDGPRRRTLVVTIISGA